MASGLSAVQMRGKEQRVKDAQQVKQQETQARDSREGGAKPTKQLEGSINPGLRLPV
jgi:hypothetical protein